MEIGISVDPRPADEMRELVAAAEAANVDLLALPDSQSMYREVYATLGMVADRTETPRVATLTTNPVTRHVSVTASAIATVDELSGGRAVLGIAPGDSAVKNTDMETPPLSVLRDAVETIRTLLAEGEAEWRGAPVRVNWSDRRVPVYLVAEGPTTLALGGHVADGVFYGGWIGDDHVEWAHSRVAVGADSGGRRVEDLTFWTAVAGCIADSRSEAIDELAHVLSAKAHITSYGGMDSIPDDLVGNFRSLGDDYRSDLHNQYDHPYNADLIDEHGLREYLADNWSVAGTPDQVRDRLEALERAGVGGVVLILRVPDPLATIDRLGEEVIPHL
jgi:5,10-methylenetetrahydromethanopterin reductase